LEAEKKRLKDLDKFADIKMKMEKARITNDDGTEAHGALGMKIDDIVEDEVKEEEVDTAIVKPRPTQRKTKTQRNKESKLRVEVSTPI